MQTRESIEKITAAGWTTASRSLTGPVPQGTGGEDILTARPISSLTAEASTNSGTRFESLLPNCRGQAPWPTTSGLVYKADPALFERLDFDDDRTFLEPTLAYFTPPISCDAGTAAVRHVPLRAHTRLRAYAGGRPFTSPAWVITADGLRVL